MNERDVSVILSICHSYYLLGHATVRVTMEIYTHLDKGKIKTEVEKLNKHIAVVNL